MQKIRIVVPKELGKELLEKIAQFNCVEFQELKKETTPTLKEIQELKEILSKTKFFDSFIEEEEKKGKSPIEFLEIGEQILLQIENLKKEREKLQKELEAIRDLKNLEFSKKEKEKLQFLDCFILKGHLSSHQKFQAYFGEELLWERIGGEREVYFLYFFKKEKKTSFLEKAKALRLEEIQIFDFSPKERFSFLQNSLKTIENKIEVLENKLRKITPSKKEWENFKSELQWKITLQSLMEKSLTTQKFYLLEGWVPKTEFEELKEKLEREFEFVLVEKIPFNPEEAPVKLQNKFFKIFEPIAKLYGLPKPTEPDPTPFLAPFFVIFFGFALSDVGYGLLLAIGGIILRLFFSKKNFSLILAPLLIILGLSTLFFGLLFGTFFGKNLAFFLDPQKEPLKILSLCFSFGLIHIATGFSIRFFHQVKHGKKIIPALAEDFSFVPILLLISFYFFQNATQDFLPSKFIAYSILFFLCFKLFLHLISSKNLFLGVFKMLGSLYNTLSFLSDTLSYSRLYALGLATGVIASTINLIAEVLKGTLKIPLISPLVFLLVLIFGHLFNIIINLLGAFVHSARLQFVEFFSKFLEGGGRAFQPLSKNFKSKL